MTSMQRHTCQRWTHGVMLAAFAMTLQGCLVISPFHGQEFRSRSTSIPIQGWTASTKAVVLECAANYGIVDETAFREVTTLRVAPEFLRDPRGQVVYSVSDSIVLPARCWYHRTYTDTHYTFIRLKQHDVPVRGNVSEFATVDRPGLRCVGNKTSHDADMTAWNRPPQCQRRTSAGDDITTIQLVARR